MKVKVEYYTIYRENRGLSAITFKIVGSVGDRCYVRFNVPDKLLDNYGEFKYSNIINEEKLNELGIEYLIKDVDGMLQIIPIGLIEFARGQISYNDYEMTLSCIEDNELHTVPLSVEGIIEAINIKAKGAQIRNKCINRVEEVIQINI